MPQQKTDRRVARTRLFMRHALMSLMLEKSYAKITVQDIIDRANIGRATFYNHYQDKDDLLLRGVAQIVHPPEDADIPHTVPGTTIPNASLPTAGMFRHSYENQMLHKVMFKRSQDNLILERVTAVMYERVMAHLTRAATDGKQTAVPLPIVAQFITGGLMALIEWWHDNDFSYTAEEMDAFFQQMVLPGIQDILVQRSSDD